MYSVSDGSHYEKRIDAKGHVLSDECIDDEIPFEIPNGWEWARLGSALELNSGLGYKKDNLAVKDDCMMRVLRGGNIGEADTPIIKDNDVMISSQFVDDDLILQNGQIITPAVTSLENVGKAAIVRTADGNTVCGGFVFFLTPYLEIDWHSEYLLRYLTSPPHVSFCRARVKKSGQAFYNLSKTSLNSALIPLPPLAEQRRIAERVEELMPLVDEYGVLEESREALDSELPERLQKSVLQRAVQGKLVPRDPSDEPASVLLERIREERTKLVAEKKVKFPKGGESVIYRASDGGYYEKRIDAKGCLLSEECIDDEIPFEIPESWEWARLGNLLSVVSDGTHKTPDYKDEGVLFLSVQNISKGYFDLDKVKYISQETHAELCKRVKPQNGDILLCRIGTLGKPIIVNVDYEFSIFVSLGLLRPIKHELAEWIVACIDSPLGLDWIEAIKVGGGTHTFKINLGDIPLFLIPVAPLAEQQRIVDRYNQLSMLL